MNPAYRYEATLVRVIDGDSVVLNVRLGFYVAANIAFRLAGIDAPELRSAGLEGEQSRDSLVELLSNATSIIVESRKTEKFGRWLGTLYVDGAITSVNQYQIERGFATSYDGGTR